MVKTLSVSGPEKLDLCYDKERDVLYISFGPPKEADDSELSENDVIIRYRGRRIIGLTVLGFSKRTSHAK